MKRILIIAATAALLIAAIAVWLWPQPASENRSDVAVDTAANEDLAAQLAAYRRDYANLMHENAGLRGFVQDLQNRIRGLEARAPDTIRIAAQPVDVSRDTLYRAPIVKDGTVIYSVLVPREDSLHEERLVTGINIGDCDDGWMPGPDRAACDAAAFGHLTLLARVGATTAAGSLSVVHRDIDPMGEIALSWRKCFRCTFGFELSLSTRNEFALTVQTGVRIF